MKMRKFVAMLLIIFAVPIWLPAGIWLANWSYETQLYAPAAPLWGCLLMVVLQILFACWVGEKKPPSVQRIRWIEARGCMAEDFRSVDGVVINEYSYKRYEYGIAENWLAIELADGRHINWPKNQFTVAGDGVLEYRH